MCPLQVIGTSEIIVRPGLINVDFADVREVVKNSGTALIGIGTGTGKVRRPLRSLPTVTIVTLAIPLLFDFHTFIPPDLQLVQSASYQRRQEKRIHIVAFD